MVAIVMVCHKGDLELKTAFLIHTLRKYLKGNFRIYLGIPDEGRYTMPPSFEFLAYCKCFNIHIYNFNNPFLESKEQLLKGDLISNKIYALIHPFEEETVLFLDSDIALLKDIDIAKIVGDTLTLALKPAGHAHVRNWELMYKAANLPMPVKKVLASVGQAEMPPYFNSGVMVFRKDFLGKFMETWVHYFLWLSDMDGKLSTEFPLFHRDQISLSLAICACDADYSILDELYNFPIRGKKIHKKSPPCLVHYHNTYSVYFEKLLEKEFLEFIKLHPFIMDSAGPLWKSLFEGSIIKRKSAVFIEYVRFNKYRLKRFLKTLKYRLFH